MKKSFMLERKEGEKSPCAKVKFKKLNRVNKTQKNKRAREETYELARIYEASRTGVSKTLEEEQLSWATH